MTTITLTPEQLQLIEQAGGQPVRVEDPTGAAPITSSRRRRRKPARRRMRRGDPGSDIPEGILRSQDAFFRDLPELLKDESLRGLWVIYHGDERIGVAHEEAAPDRGVLEARLEEGRVRRLRRSSRSRGSRKRSRSSWITNENPRSTPYP